MNRIPAPKAGPEYPTSQSPHWVVMLFLAILLCQDAFTDRELEQVACIARINSKFSHHVTYDTLALRLRAAKFVCPDNKVCVRNYTLLVQMP